MLVRLSIESSCFVELDIGLSPLCPDPQLFCLSSCLSALFSPLFPSRLPSPLSLTNLISHVIPFFSFFLSHLPCSPPPPTSYLPVASRLSLHMTSDPDHQVIKSRSWAGNLCDLPPINRLSVALTRT